VLDNDTKALIFLIENRGIR